MVTRNRRTRLVLIPGQATTKEVSDLQTDLKEELAEHKEVLKASLSELKKIKDQIMLSAEEEGHDTIDEEEDNYIIDEEVPLS